MAQKISVGNVVYCRFPKEECVGGLAHYALVVEVNEDAVGTRVRVAYGSSKQVSESGHLPRELVVSRPAHLTACGLRKPTRFDLVKTAWMDSRAVVREGEVPVDLYRDFKRAAISAGLI